MAAIPPYAVCLASGNLKIHSFRHYIAQDLHFLKAFAQASQSSDADPTSSPRFGFNQDDEDFYKDGHDFRSVNSGKQRVWWSDYDRHYDDYDDDDWDVDEDKEFWIFKIFRNFGWMLPAIAVSSLLGTATGPNAIIMALAVPLGQSILSLFFDKVWGGASSNPKSRSRRKTKQKPFARAASNTKTTQGTENETGKTSESYEAGKGRGNYQSWVAADDAPSKKNEKNGPKFGGWDELDKKTKNYKAHNRTPGVPKNELPKNPKGKLSRIGRIRDKPLLLRLLIAVFPFLGSWTKLLF